MAPPLAAGAVPRPALLEAIVGSLTSASLGQITALTGLGGSGKTVLATAACHEPSIRSRFDDGILWATLGPTPDLLRLVTSFVAAVTADTAGFVTLNEATAAWHRVAHDRDLLVVLDDVWDPAHLRAFLGEGSRCRYPSYHVTKAFSLRPRRPSTW